MREIEGDWCDKKLVSSGCWNEVTAITPYHPKDLSCFRTPARWTLSPKPMDDWILREVLWGLGSFGGKEPFSAGRFGLCCFFGSIVAGELLYLLRYMAQHGRQSGFFNYLVPVLGCLIVQFITLASTIWLVYWPSSGEYPVCIGSYISSY